MATVVPEVPALARDRAFETLYRSYVEDVYHYALALLRNPADAEDVTQTTFLNAYRAYQRGETIRKPQHWLIKIAHNVARSRYARAGRRVKEVPLDDHLEQLAVPEADRPDVQAALDALARLPLNQRAALVMRELEGRTYAEIADTLDVSVPAVETLIFRARRSMRLKANAIRALGIVPVPSSLTQLFDAGGVVAGGGAIVGSGFLLKAALAVVAGVVAAGVGERTLDQAGGGKALSPAGGAQVAAAPPTGRPAALAVALTRTASERDRAHLANSGSVSASSVRSVARGTHAGATAFQTPGSKAPPASASASSSPLPHQPAVPLAPTPQQAVDTVASATTAVSQAVSSAAPPLPVSVPSPPAVTLPAPPSLP